MSQFHTRLEVMTELAKNMDSYVKDYLVPIETNWQPADMLPDSTKDSFFADVVSNRTMSPSLSINSAKPFSQSMTGL